MKKKLLLILMSLVLVVSSLSQATQAFAEGTTNTESQINGVALTQTAIKTSGGAPTYQEAGLMVNWFQNQVTDISTMEWIAIEYYNPTGAAWPFVFKLQSGGQQVYTNNPAVQYTLLDSNFQVTGTNTTSAYISPGVSTSGWLVFPRAIFNGIDNLSGALEAMYLLLPCTAANQNNVTELHFGRIMSYTSKTVSDYSQGTVVADLSTWSEDIYQYTYAALSAGDGNVPLVSIRKVSKPAPEPEPNPGVASSEINGVSLTQTAIKTSGGSPTYQEAGLMINWFQNQLTDISTMEWIAIEYYNPTGAAWPFIFKLQSDGQQVYTNNAAVQFTLLDSNFQVTGTNTTSGYISPGVSTSGWLVFPRAIFNGIDNLSGALEAMYLLLPCTAANQNNVTELHFGRIMTYTAKTVSDYSQGTVVADLSTWEESNLNSTYAALSVGDDDVPLVTIKKVAKPTPTPEPEPEPEPEIKIDSVASQINGLALIQNAIKTSDGTTPTYQEAGVMINWWENQITDISEMEWIAVEYYNPTGAAWPFVFKLQSGSQQVHTSNSSVKYTMLDSNFKVTGSNTSPYGYVAPGVSTSGWLVFPRAIFEGIDNLSGALESIYLTLPCTAANQNNLTELHFGRIMSYTQKTVSDYSKGTVVADLSTWKDSYYKTTYVATSEGDNNLPLVTIKKAVKQDVKPEESKPSSGYKAEIVASKIDGIGLMQNAIKTKDNKATYQEAGIIVNWWENQVTDISEMEWIALEYYNPTGAPWPFVFKLQSGDKQVHTTVNNVPYILLNSDFEVVKTQSTSGYVSPDVATSGWIVLPRAIFGGIETLSGSLDAIYLTLPCTAANQNKITELHFGRIMAYTQKTVSDYSKGTVIADLATWKDSYYDGTYVSTSAGDKNVPLVTIKKSRKSADQTKSTMIGDVRVIEDFDLGYPTDEKAYNSALESMIYDAVGGIELSRVDGASGNGIKFTMVSPKEDRPDDYAGVTFTPKTGVMDWGQWKSKSETAAGFTCYVKNLSAVEITIGFEIDEYDPDQDIEKDYRGERWSIGQGARLFLYDTNKNEETILTGYNTFAIPVGFEGYVRVPFEYFTKPGWCTWGNSEFDLERIAQITISCHSVLNQGLVFAMDNVGVYYNETEVSSMFFGGNKSISNNMQLKEKNNE